MQTQIVPAKARLEVRGPLAELNRLTGEAERARSITCDAMESLRMHYEFGAANALIAS